MVDGAKKPSRRVLDLPCSTLFRDCITSGLEKGKVVEVFFTNLTAVLDNRSTLARQVTCRVEFRQYRVLWGLDRSYIEYDFFLCLIW